MFKKIAIATAVFALAAAPVLAKQSSGSSQTNSHMGIDNTSVVVANSGLNFTGGKGFNVVSTGGAAAFSSVTNQVGYNQSSCGCSDRGGSSQSNSNMGVNNLSVTVANSGANFTSGGIVKSGPAVAGSVVVNSVGTNMKGV